MTTPTIKSALPAGTILGQHAEQDAADFTAGRPLTQRVVVMVVQAGGTSYAELAKGRSAKVQYTPLLAVEITDDHEADRLRHLLADTRAERGYTVRQAPLWDHPDDDVDDRRREVLSYLSEWQLEQDPVVSDDQLEERWVSFHGGNYDHRLDKGAPIHLREFAISIGALADSEPHAEPDADGEAVDSADEPEDDGDPDTEPAALSITSPFLAPTPDDAA